MEHCSKHDIVHGGTCWCCEDSAMSAEQRADAYKDPAHLAKRGGAGIAVAAAQTKILNMASKLADVPEDILAKMVAFFSANKDAATVPLGDPMDKAEKA